MAYLEIQSRFDGSKASELHINAAISISGSVEMTHDPEAGARKFGSTCEDRALETVQGT